MAPNQVGKINFFKKFWYSISKPSKYEEMREEGLWSSVKYILGVIAIFSLILSIIATILQSSYVKEAISYLEEKLPEMTFKENKLDVKSEEAIILNDAKFILNFGNIVVINSKIEKNEAIKEYCKLATNKYNVIVFLNSEYIVITNKYKPKSESEDGITTYKYQDEASKYIKDDSIEYNKNSIISYLNQSSSNTRYISYFFTYYFGMLAIIYLFYTLLISASLWFVTKISKQNWKYKQSVMNTIYASTLSIIFYVLYMIINYFTKFTISITDVISILIIYIYIFIILKKEKGRVPRNEKR